MFQMCCLRNTARARPCRICSMGRSWIRKLDYITTVRGTMMQKTSIFLNVDPLAEKYSHVSPYTYSLNNPINLIDPTGMEPEWREEGKGILVAEKGDNAKTLREHLNKNYKDANVSQTAADKLYSTMKDGKVNIDQLNPETLNKNLFGYNYPGPWNPRKYNGQSDYSIPPTEIEIPAFIHDKEYDKVGAVGAKGLFLDPKTIEADKKFVKSMEILKNKYMFEKKFIKATQAKVIGEGLNAAAQPKQAVETIKSGINFIKRNLQNLKYSLLEAITPPATLTTPRF